MIDVKVRIVKEALEDEYVDESNGDAGVSGASGQYRRRYCEKLSEESPRSNTTRLGQVGS
jgi:hypothetical protein